MGFFDPACCGHVCHRPLECIPPELLEPCLRVHEATVREHTGPTGQQEGMGIATRFFS
jgi:hypothetical protein